MKIRFTLALLATVMFAAAAPAIQINTNARCPYDGATCEIGGSTVDSITLTTDGTGTGEIILPTGAISTAEILDATVSTTDIAADTITFANISNSSAIDETTYFTAADTISLELVPSATAGDTDFFVINANQVDDANATDDFRAMVMELTSESGDAGDTFIGIDIEWEEGTANTVIDAAIAIDNEETTASTMTDAIIVTSSGVASGVTDGLDVSASNIANAVNIGANPIVTGNVAMTLGDATTDSIAMTADGGVVTIDGTIISAATGSLGWSIVAGANVACNTTCTSACVMGFELDAFDATSLLECDDATADTCLCAGAS